MVKLLQSVPDPERLIREVDRAAPRGDVSTTRNGTTGKPCAAPVPLHIQAPPTFSGQFVQQSTPSPDENSHMEVLEPPGQAEQPSLRENEATESLEPETGTNHKGTDPDFSINGPSADFYKRLRAELADLIRTTVGESQRNLDNAA